MGDNWVRPYPPGSGRWLVIVWEAFALALLTWTTIQQFHLAGHAVPATAGLLAGVWAVGTWRILQHGVYVSGAGVLIRGLLRSRTMRWPEIAGVRLHRVTRRWGRWQLQNDTTVLIDRHHGAPVKTELWAEGVDFHARPTLFRAVYQDLLDRHQASLPAPVRND